MVCKMVELPLGHEEPDVVVRIFADADDGTFIGLGLVDRCDFAAWIDGQNSGVVRNDPQMKLAVFKQLQDLAPGDVRGFFFVVGLEVDTIETGESIASAQPKVAIAGLGDRKNDVLWESFIRSPVSYEESVVGCAQHGRVDAEGKDPKGDLPIKPTTTVHAGHRRQGAKELCPKQGPCAGKAAWRTVAGKQILRQCGV